MSDGPGRFLSRDRTKHPAAFHPAYKSSVHRSPTRALLSFPSSLSEETGPVFGHSILNEGDSDLITNFAKPGEAAIGPRILVNGRVLDENARAVPGALIEIWQANSGGRYRHNNDGYLAPLDPNFSGCGRCITAEDGSFEFRTVQPGAYPWPNGPNAWRPMHIHFSVFGHSFAQRLITQMYFEGDPLIPFCPIAGAISDQRALDRLVAPLDLDAAKPMDALAYKFDIVLRGRQQSVFENHAEGM
ncbi:MAG: protocatechuate 3,4-dioxygenase subunit beta [Paracoccaceae bacterium]